MKKRRSVSFAVRQTKGSFSSDFAMDTRLDLQVLITVAIGVSFANPVDFHALSMMGTAAEQTEGCITDLTLTKNLSRSSFKANTGRRCDASMVTRRRRPIVTVCPLLL